MQKLIQAIFVSSSGKGNVSELWKGALIIAVAYYFPGTTESEVMAILSSGGVLVGIAWSTYGALMKVVRRRWSAV